MSHVVGGQHGGESKRESKKNIRDQLSSNRTAPNVHKQSTLCSSSWLKHLLHHFIYSLNRNSLCLILCMCLSLSSSFLPPFTLSRCHCLLLDRGAFPPAARGGKQPAYSKSSAVTEMEAGRRRRRTEQEKTGGDGESIPWRSVSNPLISGNTHYV